MKIFRTLLLALIILSFTSSCKEEDPPTKDERMEWWREAKFGMFIHWGVYAIPGGDWEGKTYDGISEWIMAHADIPIADYETLPPKFNPVKYNPAEWVKIAKDAGMKYIVITSKHHDGFAIYDSKVSDYDVVDKTPYGKDLLLALSEECKKAGIKFATYYSILDWHHPSQEVDREGEKPGFYASNKMKEGRKREYIDYMKAQLEEIVLNYDPAIIWFDGGWTKWWLPEDGKEVMDFLWNLNPRLIINNRAAGSKEMRQVLGDYLTPEQLVPGDKEQKDWETCMTMNDSWGFKRKDNNWKSAEVLIHNLVDIASKGGNFLLNVGPSDEGLIPDESIERLAEMGNWMKINGEAIYGTTNWKIWKEGENQIITDYYKENLERRVEFSLNDKRFISKDNVIYVALFVWPQEQFVVKSLNEENLGDDIIKSVELLGSENKLEWTSTVGGLEIIPPADRPCDYAYIFKVTL